MNLVVHQLLQLCHPSILSIPVCLYLMVFFVDNLSSSKQLNGELLRTEGAESASLQEDSSRTEVSVEKSESSREEHPNVTVIVDGPDDGAKSAVSDSQPQPVINHSLPENGEQKPCDAPLKSS